MFSINITSQRYLYICIHIYACETFNWYKTTGAKTLSRRHQDNPLSPHHHQSTTVCCTPLSLPASANENPVRHLPQMVGDPASHLCSVCQLGSRTFRSEPFSLWRLQVIRRSWPVESFDLCTFPADLNSSTLGFLWAHAGADKCPLCIRNESYLRIGCYYGSDNGSALRLLNVGSKGFVNLCGITVSSL